MKTNRLMLACGLSGLLAATQIAPALSADNPYVGAITNRNPFGLKPPPDPASLVPVVQAPPLPNVLLAGITTLFGNPRACLRVPRPAKPPEPAKEVSVFLSPGGSAEEGIRVLEINVAAGTVKIENNGTVQDLDMTKNAPKSTGVPPPAPAGLPVPPPRPGSMVPVPPGPGAVPAVTTFGRPMRGASGANSGAVVGGGPGQLGAPAEPQPLSLEDQTILIEANRLRYQKQVEAGELPPLPPTDLTEHMNSPLDAPL